MESVKPFADSQTDVNSSQSPGSGVKLGIRGPCLLSSVTPHVKNCQKAFEARHVPELIDSTEGKPFSRSSSHASISIK